MVVMEAMFWGLALACWTALVKALLRAVTWDRYHTSRPQGVKRVFNQGARLPQGS